MLMVTMLVVIGCNKRDDSSGVRVTTYTPQDITQNSAVCGGEVIISPRLTIDELGVCWSDNSIPTADDEHLFTVNWNEPFVCTIRGLSSNTKYYVRAYALRGSEYYYGDTISFITEDNSGVSGVFNGHEYVDLDLPSGTLWATCNVGATTAQGYGYGYHFAWGETTTKHYYSWSSYKYCQGSYTRLTKYCTKPSYAYDMNSNDNLTVLQLCDDAATANWGNGWRTPTYDEWQELYNNTINIKTTQNGVVGRLFSSENGKTLFLPADGFRSDDNLNEGDIFYWSSSLNTNTPYCAWCINCGMGFCNMHMFERRLGLSVRPVCSK